MNWTHLTGPVVHTGQDPRMAYPPAAAAHVQRQGPSSTPRSTGRIRHYSCIVALEWGEICAAKMRSQAMNADELVPLSPIVPG